MTGNRLPNRKAFKTALLVIGSIAGCLASIALVLGIFVFIRGGGQELIETLPNYFQDMSKARPALASYLHEKYGWDEDDYSIESYDPSFGAAFLNPIPHYRGYYEGKVIYENTEVAVYIDPDLIDEDYPDGGYKGGDDYQLDEVKEAVKVFLNELCRSQGVDCEIVSVSFPHSSTRKLTELTYSLLDPDDPMSAILKRKGDTYWCYLNLEASNTGQLSDEVLQDEVYDIVQRYLSSRAGGLVLSLEVVVVE